MNYKESMSLRDYFAAKALAGYTASKPDNELHVIAIRCYDLADAMLEARGDDQ